MRVIYDDDVMDRFQGIVYYYPEDKFDDVYLNHIKNPHVARVKKDATRFLRSIGVDDNEQDIVVVYRRRGKNVVIYRNLDTKIKFIKSMLFLER
jgi:hypothetical protein